MSLIRRHSRLLLVALSCVALGAGASAIASAGAATHGSAKTAHARGQHAGKGMRGHGLRLARRAVHAELVVPTKQGFVNVTVDRGAVASVSGDQLTITEGTPKQTYKTVTLTVPTSAKVRENGKASSLSSLTKGQRVIVVSAPKRTFVIAHDAKAARG